jgi:hypothetical protein
MLIELITAAAVGTSVIIIALGHVLLVGAIYRCMREDYVGGRGQRTQADGATMDIGVKPLPAR